MRRYQEIWQQLLASQTKPKTLKVRCPSLQKRLIKGVFKEKGIDTLYRSLWRMEVSLDKDAEGKEIKDVLVFILRKRINLMEV